MVAYFPSQTHASNRASTTLPVETLPGLPSSAGFSGQMERSSPATLWLFLIHPERHTIKFTLRSASSGITELTREKDIYMKQLITKLATEDSGQDLIEYALVAALVGLGAVAAMKGLSNSVKNTYSGVGTALTNA
jgi:pilus assembly protein Flp/PilA